MIWNDDADEMVMVENLWKSCWDFGPEMIMMQMINDNGDWQWYKRENFNYFSLEMVIIMVINDDNMTGDW